MKRTVLWLTGLSGAGKTTLSTALAAELLAMDVRVALLDADDFRRRRCVDLGFSLADRGENVRRMAVEAEALSRECELVIAAAVSPLRSMRKAAAEIIGEGFLEVFVSASLAACQRRDPKGLYAKFAAGEITDMTGLDSPYEEPLNAHAVVRTDRESVAGCVEALLALLRSQGDIGRGEM